MLIQAGIRDPFVIRQLDSARPWAAALLDRVQAVLLDGPKVRLPQGAPRVLEIGPGKGILSERLAAEFGARRLTVADLEDPSEDLPSLFRLGAEPVQFDMDEPWPFTEPFGAIFSGLAFQFSRSPTSWLAAQLARTLHEEGEARILVYTANLIKAVAYRRAEAGDLSSVLDVIDRFAECRECFFHHYQLEVELLGRFKTVVVRDVLVPLTLWRDRHAGHESLMEAVVEHNSERLLHVGQSFFVRGPRR